MLYKIIIGSLSVVIVFLIVLFYIYQRQVKNICQQLRFRREKNSNLRITSELDMGGLRQLADILNEQVEIERKQRVRYQKKERLISDTYTSLSHDIRTPLTSLDGYVQLLVSSDSKEEQEHYLNVITNRITSLKEMLEELFLFTKLGSDSYELSLSCCDLNHIVKDTIFSYYDEWKAQKIEPEIKLPDGVVTVMGNEQALSRTIQNVLKNALVHGGENLRIGMYVPEKQQVVRLEISNPCKCIESIDISRVFERFYRADEMRTRNSTGLGLAIAKELVLRMNGTIEAKLCGREFMIKMGFPLVEKMVQEV